MTEELVTIGLPFASTPVDYLEVAVRSVLAQTYTNWELLLLVDGAIPALEARVRAIRDDRVRVISDGQNKGLAARLNEIASVAQGALVFRMDADDAMHPERLEVCVREMHATDVDVLGTRAYAVDAETRILGMFAEPSLPTSLSGYLRSNAFTHPTVVAKRSWLRAHPYDETLRRSEDKELWLRTAHASAFRKLDIPLFFYRIGDLSAAKQRRDAKYDRRILNEYGPELVGSLATKAHVGRSLAKQAAFGALSGMGRTGILARSKVIPLDDSGLLAAVDALRISSNAAVQGW